MDPPVEAFIPTKVFTEESQVEVKDLQGLIDDAEVDDAVLVYKLLEKNKTEIPAELKQSFYEMICFYNCEQPLDEDLVEERWFRQDERRKERSRKTWKDYGLAEQIFNDTEPKDSRAYSAIIRGMCKFYQVEKAWALYNDALSKNLSLDVEVFNSVLNVANLLKESGELRWELMVEIMKTMKDQNVTPNLGTLNGCLSTISQSGGRYVRDYALQTLSEFKRAGVEPSLATWYFVLQTFCKERGPVSHVLIDILNQIEGKEFQIRDPRDIQFFVTAMEICNLHLHDKGLAKRVNALLHTGDNYNLIGDSFKESVYYRNFFRVLISTEPLETFMETYNLLVPNVYTPEPTVMEDILKSIETTGAIEQIPLIWSHIVLFDQNTRENLLMLLTRIMIQNKPNPDFPQQAHLCEKFGSIAYGMFTKIEEKNESRSNPVVWTAKILGDVITLLCQVEEYERTVEVFDKLANNQQSILGEPDISSMLGFVQLCITKKQPSKAINCLQYCSDIGFPETKDIARSIVKSFTLDEHAMRKLLSLVGTEVVEQAQQELQQENEAKLKQTSEEKAP